MVINKPTILLYAFNPDKSILNEICAGIEEEGLLYELQYAESSDVHDISYEAANASVLGVGLGIVQSKVSLQIANIPKHKDVFYIEDPNKEQCRNLGSNAARAVKRIPFKKV